MSAAEWRSNGCDWLKSQSTRVALLVVFFSSSWWFQSPSAFFFFFFFFYYLVVVLHSCAAGLSRRVWCCCGLDACVPLLLLVVGCLVFSSSSGCCLLLACVWLLVVLCVCRARSCLCLFVSGLVCVAWRDAPRGRLDWGFDGSLLFFLRACSCSPCPCGLVGCRVSCSFLLSGPITGFYRSCVWLTGDLGVFAVSPV